MTDIRRIDQVAADALRGLWKRLLHHRDQLWLWWRYAVREPLTDPDGANQALKELCGYKVLPRTETRLKHCITLLRRWRFGVLMIFVPAQQQSRFWTLCWVRWVDDPLEFYLVRSAARGTQLRTRKDRPQRSADGPSLSALDEVSEELHSLLSVQADSPRGEPAASGRKQPVP